MLQGTQDLYGWTKWGNATFENTLHLSIAEVIKCVSGLIWGLFGAATACKTLCFHCLSLRKVTIFEHKMSHERTFRQPNNQFATAEAQQFKIGAEFAYLLSCSY